jgi:hypothetical protein
MRNDNRQILSLALVKRGLVNLALREAQFCDKNFPRGVDTRRLCFKP